MEKGSEEIETSANRRDSKDESHCVLRQQREESQRVGMVGDVRLPQHASFSEERWEKRRNPLPIIRTMLKVLPQITSPGFDGHTHL